MTLQDFTGTLNNSFINSFQIFLSLALPIFVAIFIFLIGLTVAQVLVYAFNEIFKFVSLEKSLEKISNYQVFIKAHPDLSMTSSLAKLVWWGTLVLFLVAGLEISGYLRTTVVLDNLANFFPRFVEGSLFLLFGGLLSYLTYIALATLGGLSKFPLSSLFAKLVAFVFVVYSFIQALLAFGISSELIRFLLLGAILASFLGLGLALKEQISDVFRSLRKTKFLLKGGDK